ncbi:MAG TPA: archaeosine synthase subunit alpha [Methanoregulaceae archaeon]|nr:archaeosine synthase subunit alpha [Methanoregulaceae archaeon]
MTGVDIKKRDGLARSGTCTLGGSIVKFPLAVVTTELFPALNAVKLANIPLSADEKFTSRYWPKYPSPMVCVHPFHTQGPISGDIVMVPGWHTAFRNPRLYVSWLKTLKTRVPPDTLWYAPASALPSNVHILCYSGFDLFDFTACDLASVTKKFLLPEGEFGREMMESGICSCDGCRAGDLKVHNRLALVREIGLVSAFIAGSQLREFAESRCRLRAEHVAVMRLLDAEFSMLEQALPIVRNTRFGAMSGETLNRVEVRRFASRVVGRYVPPPADTAVLLPCSARKPYSSSQSHRKYAEAIQGRAHELIVTSPLGLVPRELELVYPAAHYDVPVTGYWDREEQAFISGIIGQYLIAHPYRRVIAHLEGGALEVAKAGARLAGIELEYTTDGRRTTDPVSLRSLDSALSGNRRMRQDILSGTCSWQFGTVPETTGITFRGRYPAIRFEKGRVQLFSLDGSTGLIRPTFEGWKLLGDCYQVSIGDFLPQGDILVPGVTGADPAIREGDEVLVQGPQVIATGRAAMSAEEMKRSRHGIAVRVRKIKRV